MNNSILNALVITALCLGAHAVAAESTGPSPTATPPMTDSVTVDMKNMKGESVGTAWISQKTEKGITIQLDLHGLPSGTHAIHIHNKASCVAPDFKSAGDHFSPKHMKHGDLAKGGPHAGDLPNIEVGVDGMVKTTIESNHLNLGASLKSLQKGAGTALVIHAGPDDYKSQPAGNSGDRIACGEIAPLAK
jgi:Cu-Zn family superoxide dismutase